MPGILMLFQEKDEKNPEKFSNPNITSVKITIEGVPNMIYSQGLPKKRIFEEAKRLLEYDMNDPQRRITDFYNDKYALWIDLHATVDKNSTGDGTRLQQTHSGVLLEIKRTATTKDLICHIFILSDALLNVSGGELSNK